MNQMPICDTHAHYDDDAFDSDRDILLDEGLKEVFDDISPIMDYSGKLSLEFIDFTYDEKDAKYTIASVKNVM